MEACGIHPRLGVNIMRKQEQIKTLSQITSKEEAATTIVELMNRFVSPTFGIQDDEGGPIDPTSYPEEYFKYHHEEGEEIPEQVQQCKDIMTNHEKALEKAGEIAKEWGIPFDPALFESIMNKMRGNGDGMWNSSSIGC